MAGSEPKEHHFVPQFYLRAFGNGGKSIRLFNIARRQHVAGAPIKSQCARHKLHAFRPGLEQTLATLEGAAATAIRSIVNAEQAPAPPSTEWQDAIGFMALQKVRTVRAIQSVETLTDFMLGHAPEPGDAVTGLDREQLKAGLPHPLALMFGYVREIIGHAADLTMHLLVNETDEEFVTSDDPVVMHNQYCEGIGYRGVLGWDCSGLQVFLPLSPRLLLILFDPAVYKVEGTKKGLRTTAIRETCHVRRLNELQVLNAHENIYYSAPPTAAFERFCEAVTDRRLTGRTSMMESVPLERADGTSTQVLHSFEPLLPVRLDLPHIDIRRRARKVPLDARGGLYRSRENRYQERHGPSDQFEVQNLYLR